MMAGKQNIVHTSLVARDKIIMSPFYMILEIIKKFVKSIDKSWNIFSYIYQKCSQLIIEKIRAAVFGGYKIRHLTKDTQL